MIDALRSTPPGGAVEPIRTPRPRPAPSARRVPEQRAVSESATSPPATPSQPTPLRRLVTDLDRQRQQLDHAIRQAASGRNLSPAELISLQARVYVYGESLEVLSHLLDRAVSSVKTLLNVQV